MYARMRSAVSSVIVRPALSRSTNFPSFTARRPNVLSLMPVLRQCDLISERMSACFMLPIIGLLPNLSRAIAQLVRAAHTGAIFMIAVDTKRAMECERIVSIGPSGMADLDGGQSEGAANAILNSCRDFLKTYP